MHRLSLIGGHKMYFRSKCMTTKNDTKKCPLCAEEVKVDAIICKHCKSNLAELALKEEMAEKARQVAVAQEQAVQEKRNKIKEQNERKNKIGVRILVGILIALTYKVSIPVLLGWIIWMNWKTKGAFIKDNWASLKLSIFVNRKMLIAWSVVIILLGMFISTIANEMRTPTITISEPVNNYTTTQKSVEIKGNVDPINASTTAYTEKGNGKNYLPIKFSDGKFIVSVNLNDPVTRIILTADNDGSATSTVLIVNRKFSDSEMAKYNKLKDDERRANEIAKANAKANREKYAKLQAEIADNIEVVNKVSGAVKRVGNFEVNVWDLDDKPVNNKSKSPYYVIVNAGPSSIAGCSNAKSVIFEIMKNIYGDPSISPYIVRVQFTAYGLLKGSLGSSDEYGIDWQSSGPTNFWTVLNGYNSDEITDGSTTHRTYGVNIGCY